MSTLNVNVIGERTSGSGVTVDGVLLKDGNVDGVDVSAITPGITEADQWRLTANITNTTADITSNLERNDTTGFGYIGTGMTESSGIFTFPSTGKYYIIISGAQSSGGASDNFFILKGTTDNSSYSTWILLDGDNSNASSAEWVSGGSFIVDVTDTANVKVKLATQHNHSSAILHGSSSYNRTSITFIKLGET